MFGPDAIFVQRATVWEHLYNYCATENAMDLYCQPAIRRNATLAVRLDNRFRERGMHPR
jgi:hypothetical protein